MTPGEIAAEALLRARRTVSRAMSRITDDPASTYVSGEALARSVEGSSVSEIAERIRARRGVHLTPGLARLGSTAATVRDLFPHSIDASRAEAEAILNHQIAVFGRACDLGRPIDWHRDPHSGLRWPLGHYTRVPLILGHGGDVRVVWELNRLGHLATLGRAYALTGDERYTEEFLLQLASWQEANPPRFGPNWLNAMEAAIRAVNIIAALEMFAGSQQLTDAAIRLLLKMLISHGGFIRANLEFTHRLSSNHFLSDLIGLFAIGMTMPELKQSSEWVSFSTEHLLIEMERQVLADGVDYEGSIAYHRFVLEIFALFFSINREAGVEIPRHYWEYLSAMFDFTRHYLKPDGTAPRIGDSDDGRLIAFKSRPPDDHSYLMSIAAVLLKGEKFKLSSDIDEEAIWWFGSTAREYIEGLPGNEQPESKAFPESQIIIQRHEQLYAIIDCGDHGARGRGSHAHSDALSIEVFAFGRTFLRDPGTFVYTGSARWRNLFRSTAYHNTVRIDGEDISQINPTQLFLLGPNVRPRVISWESNDERDVLDAEHHGYQRLASPVTHRRVVTFDKREGYWIIEDGFTGEGRHRFEFFFNFDAGLEVIIDGDNVVTARDQRSALVIVPTSRRLVDVMRTDRWLSPSYGTRVSSSGIIFPLIAEVPFENRVLLIPFRPGDEDRVEKIRSKLAIARL
jgi:hypothetical protein